MVSARNSSRPPASSTISARPHRASLYDADVKRTQLFRPLLVVCALLGLAVSCYRFRRATIRSFFRDGPLGAAPLLTRAPADAAGLSQAPRVRVLLIDGLSASLASFLPTLNQACAQGQDVMVDMGFPTVSLPVQHALWTGLTQTQAGILYRITPLLVPPLASLPVQIPQSIAVAESHNEIVGSFGFAVVDAPVGAKVVTPEDQHWRAAGFAAASTAAVASPARLAFVHILRVDEAGHAGGASSPAYSQAAHTADASLQAMLNAAPDRQATRWFVLSDHGHRQQGGHADAEETIRLVRACIFGAGIAPAVNTTPVHLIDLHRALADSLGVVPAAGAVGRPWRFALTHPNPGATLPTPGFARWLAAAGCLLAGLGLTGICARSKWVLWPWWLLAAFASLVLVRGHITLSNPVVYPPLGLSIATAVGPGILVLLVQAAFALRVPPISSLRVAGASLALLFAALVAAAVLCGAVQTWASVSAAPPLMPVWSALTSVLATTLASAALVLALLVLVFGLCPRR